MGELQVTVIRHWIPHVISASSSIPRKIHTKIRYVIAVVQRWKFHDMVSDASYTSTTPGIHQVPSNFMPRPPGVVLQGISGGWISVSTLENMLGTRCWHGDIPQGGADSGQGAAAIATDSGHGCGKVHWKPCSTILGRMNLAIYIMLLDIYLGVKTQVPGF